MNIKSKHIDRKIVRTYNVRDGLSICLWEIPRRASFPKCSYCGEGNFWNETWPAALALSRYLVGEFPSERLNGCRALVLGCGTGLDGIVIAKLGATVSFLDHVPKALLLAYRNCLLNKIEPYEMICCCWRDSKKARKIGKYDLLIGSDVLYNSDDADWIKSLLITTLKTDGMALFADPVRHGVMVFFKLLAESGFRVKWHWANPRWVSVNQRIRIYCVEQPRVNSKQTSKL